MSKVNVYENGEVVARVEYNSDLDFWDGNNWTCGSTGRHLGITRLRKSKQFVLIHGTQWQGERDSAEVVSDKEAYQAIVQSGNTELLDKYPDLQKFDDEIDTDGDLEEEKTTIQITKALKLELDGLKIVPAETYQEILLRLVQGSKAKVE